MKAETYYAVFSLIMGICATVLIYKAWMYHDKAAILVICILLGCAYADIIFARKNSVAMSFIKGLTEERVEKKDGNK
jgi:hypothetical protein